LGSVANVTYREGQKEGTTLCYTAIRNIFFEAKKRAGITKPASPHTLRHSLPLI
jgi:site-specific recombinase XerD